MQTALNQVSAATPITLGYLRLPKVLEMIPVSKSTWWEGVKTGRFPQPVKITPKVTAWKVDDIRTIIAEIDAGAVE